MHATNSHSKKGSLKHITTPTQHQRTEPQKVISRVRIKNTNIDLLLLVFLVVFAVAALYNLGYMSVQWDEMPHLIRRHNAFRGQTWDYMTTYGYYPPIFDLVLQVVLPDFWGKPGCWAFGGSDFFVAGNWASV